MDGVTRYSEEAAERLLIHARALHDEATDHPPATVRRAQQLATQAVQLGAWQAAAVALTSQAWAHRELYEHDDAARVIDEAVAAARRAAGPEEQARALIIRAMIHLELGQTGAARADLDAARHLGRIDPELAFATSVLADKTGQLAQARRLLEDVAVHADCPASVRVKALNNLGCLLAESDPGAALSALRDAAALATGVSAHLGAIVEHNRGVALAHAGQVPEALRTFEAVRRRLVELGAPTVEHLLEVAEVFGRLRLLPEARHAAEAALAALSQDGGALVRAEALVTAGRLAEQDGDVVQARTLLSEAQRLYAEQQRPHGAAVTAVALARLAVPGTRPLDAPGPAHNDGPSQATLDRAWQAADVLHRLGHDLDAARAWLVCGELAQGLDEADQARHAWVKAEAAAQRVDDTVRWEAIARRALLAGDAAAALDAVGRALDLVDRRALLADAVDLRHRIGAARIGFEQLHRQAMRGRSAADRVEALLRTRPPVGSWATAPPTGPDEDRDLWRRLSRQLGTADDPEVSASVLAEFREVERRLLVQRWSAGTGASGDRPDGAAALLAGLAESVPDPVVVLVVRDGSDAVGYRVTSGRVGRPGAPAPLSTHPWAADEVPLGGWADLTTALNQIHRGLERVATATGEVHRRARAAVGRILDDLDRRVAPLVQDGQDVLVLVDRGLEGAAWAALPSLWPTRVRVAALAAPAAQPAAEPARCGVRRVVVTHGPGLDHARHEADVVAGLWSGAEVTTCLDAGTTLASVGSAQVVHVAAHAALRWDNPLLSEIRLHDGPLAVGELIDVAAAPQLLHLSCCSLGAAGSDPGLVGAGAMLVQHGVRSVVASTISLSDRTASTIAAAVHTAVRQGQDPGWGLAQSRQGVDPTDPAAGERWAALAGTTVLVGVR